jgi:hypothetical protein
MKGDIITENKSGLSCELRHINNYVFNEGGAQLFGEVFSRSRSISQPLSLLLTFFAFPSLSLSPFPFPPKSIASIGYSFFFPLRDLSSKAHTLPVRSMLCISIISGNCSSFEACRNRCNGGAKSSYAALHLHPVCCAFLLLLHSFASPPCSCTTFRISQLP